MNNQAWSLGVVLPGRALLLPDKQFKGFRNRQNSGNSKILIILIPTTLVCFKSNPQCLSDRSD